MCEQTARSHLIECRSCRAELGWQHENGGPELRAAKALPAADGSFFCVRCWAHCYRKRSRRAMRRNARADVLQDRNRATAA